MTELGDMANDYNELVRENDKLKEEIEKIKQRFEPQAFTDLLNEVENEYNLQKENERLKQIILGNEEEIEELKKDKDYFSDALDKQIEATLKLQEAYDTSLAENKEIYKKLSDTDSKLDEAKEIIKRYIEYDRDITTPNEYLELLNKAKQFLEEINK